MSQKKPRWQGSFDKVYCPGNRLWIETTGETTAHSLSGQQPVYEEVPGEYLELLSTATDTYQRIGSSSDNQGDLRHQICSCLSPIVTTFVIKKTSTLS